MTNSGVQGREAVRQPAIEGALFRRRDWRCQRPWWEEDHWDWCRHTCCPPAGLTFSLPASLASTPPFSSQVRIKVINQSNNFIFFKGSYWIFS
jgi:hypothetical protein